MLKERRLCNGGGADAKLSAHRGSGLGAHWLLK